MEIYHRISAEERDSIALLNAQGHTYTFIAETLNRSVSTIGREVFRHSECGGLSGYRAGRAHQKAQGKARSSHQRRAKLLLDEQMLTLVKEKLRLRWSPKQISTWLKVNYTASVSAETIYRHIYLLPRGELKKELISYLRHRKPLRGSRKKEGRKRGVIPDMISIEERPAEVADRTVPGHWEADLIIGKDHQSAIGTIVERQTRYVLIVHLKAKDAESVRIAFAKKLRQLPASLRKTFTYDQGKEMSQHKEFAVSTGMQVYFCHPHSPWERGTCENTNMLIRGFFPKGTDFNTISAQKVNWVQHALNERPRETLGFKTPKEVLNKLIIQA